MGITYNPPAWLKEPLPPKKELKLYINPKVNVPRLKIFLESRARRSVKTAITYGAGFVHFQDYLRQVAPELTIETVIEAIKDQKIDVYRLLDGFVSYLVNRGNAAESIHSWVTGVKSYFYYNDIDIQVQKFKNKVTLPSKRKEDEQAIDVQDVRKILLAVTNRRLKAYCLFLACAGPRAIEALAVRVRDIDFTVNPTKIYMQAKYAKNKLPREVYLTDEATEYLKRWLDFKYEGKERKPDDLVFAVFDEATPYGMYPNINKEFRAILKTIGLNERKAGMKRHTITIHTFRRFAKTTIEDCTSHSFSEYILGHKKSVYYTKKEPERRELYKQRCMRYLTFLDFSVIEAAGKTMEAQLADSSSEIAELKRQMAEDRKWREEKDALLKELLEERKKKRDSLPPS